MSSITSSLSSLMLSSVKHVKKLTPASDKDAYRYWLEIVKFTLLQFNLVSIVEDSRISEIIEKNSAVLKAESNNPGATTSVTFDAAVSDDEKKEREHAIMTSNQAYWFLMQLVDEKLFMLLAHVHVRGDSFGLLREIQRKFEPLNSITGFQARLDLMQAKLKPGESYPEFANRLKGLHDEVSRFPKNEEMAKIIPLFNALPSETQRLILPELLKNENVKFDEIVNTLYRADEYRKLEIQRGAKPAAGAFATTSDNSRDKNRNKSNREMPQCTHCNRRGHTAERCWKNPASPDYRPPGENAKSEQDSTQENKRKTNKPSEQSKKAAAGTFQFLGCTMNSQILSSNTMTQVENHDTVKWILDSGAERHCCNDPRAVSNLRECATESLTGFDGSVLQFNQLATVLITVICPSSGKSLELRLDDVAFSTKFEMNLLSSSKLWETGRHESILRESGIIRFSGGKVELKLPRVNGLYVLNQKISLKQPNQNLALSASVNNRNSDAEIEIENSTRITQALDLLHRQTGHINAQALSRLIGKNAANGLEKFNITDINRVRAFACDSCALSKASRAHYSSSAEKYSPETRPGQHLYADILGPILIDKSNQRIEVESAGGFFYASVIVDKATSFLWIRCLKNKSEATAHLRWVISTNSHSRPTETLSTDGGAEYGEQEFQEFLVRSGVRHRVSPPHTPEKNGKVERAIQSIMNCVRVLLLFCKLPAIFWPLAAETGVYLLNNYYIRANGAKSSAELFTGEKPSIKSLVVFGCNAYIYNNQRHSKVEPTAVRGIMVGYDLDNYGVWKILRLDTLKVEHTRNVTFNQNLFTHVELLSTQLYQHYDCLYNEAEDYQNLYLELEGSDEKSSDPDFIPARSAVEIEPIAAEADDDRFISDRRIADQRVHFEDEIEIEPAAADNQLASEADVRGGSEQILQRESASEADDESAASIPRRRSGRLANIEAGPSAIPSAAANRSNNGNPWKLADNPQDRERWLKLKAAPNYQNADEETKSEFTTRLGLPANPNRIPWAKISKDSALFKSTCEALNCPIEFESIPEKRGSVPAATLGTVNYEKDLTTGNQNIFGDAPRILSTKNPNSDDSESDDPTTISEARSRPEWMEWKAAIEAEFDALERNKTWTAPIPLPKGKKAIPTKWVFKSKFDADGKLVKRKARLTPKGCCQRKGQDYNETFAPVMKYVSFRILMAIAAINDLEIHQFDVDSAFLHATLDEEIYIFQPEGLNNSGAEKLVRRLLKSLYGLKQAPMLWNKDMDSFLLSLGFKRLKSDSCVYIKRLKSGRFIILGLFVDDAIILFSILDEAEWNEIKNRIKSKYSIKDMGEAQFILGMRITRDRKQRNIFIDQQAYIEKTLKKFNYQSISPYKIPGTPVNDLEFDSELPIANDLSRNLYQSFTGSALYAAISSRPDIAHATSIICRFNANPQMKHFNAAKRIFKYLAGTKGKTLLMNGKRNQIISSAEPILQAWTDSDWAGDHSDRKSISGFVIKLNNCPIHWTAKKQSTISLSSCEAEIVAIGLAVREIQWIRKFLIELEIFSPSTPPAVINCDNSAAVQISSEDLANTRTKHIAVNYHFIKQSCDDREISLKWIPTTEQEADLFTKPLQSNLFNKFRAMLMGE